MEIPKEFEQTIKAYLNQRATSDKQFAQKYANPAKSLEKCCKYIMSEASKKGNIVVIKDEIVFGMAIHYYDEPNITTTVSTHSCSIQTSPQTAKKEKDAEQLSLFDTL